MTPSTPPTPPDLFEHKADEYDTRPVPMQISTGVFAALQGAVPLSDELEVMDFGAGTGLISEKLAPHVRRIVAVDVSPAMLAKLAEKPGLEGSVETVCQDLLQAPLGRTFDLVVSAMAMHHVQDTAHLLGVLHDHVQPGGRIALADLDTEEGDFHPHDTHGVYHAGFDRDQLGAQLAHAGFADVHFETACDVVRDGRRYPVFLVTAVRPG